MSCSCKYQVISSTYRFPKLHTFILGGDERKYGPLLAFLKSFPEIFELTLTNSNINDLRRIQVVSKISYDIAPNCTQRTQKSRETTRTFYAKKNPKSASLNFNKSPPPKLCVRPAPKAFEDDESSLISSKDNLWAGYSGVDTLSRGQAFQGENGGSKLDEEGSGLFISCCYLCM